MLNFNIPIQDAGILTDIFTARSNAYSRCVNIARIIIDGLTRCQHMVFLLLELAIPFYRLVISTSLEALCQNFHPNFLEPGSIFMLVVKQKSIGFAFLLPLAGCLY